MYKCQFTLLILFLSYICISNTTFAQVENSNLSSGEIYKIPISETGIYSIDLSYLKSLDISTNTLSPNTLQVFGNRGGIIPEANNVFRQDDLMEIPVISTDTNNKWDENDKIIFYAEGCNHIDTQDTDLKYHTNPYDTQNYIFIKINGNTSKKLPTYYTGDSPTIIHDFHYKLLRHEDEYENILAGKNNHQGTGREWFGEYFTSATSRNYLQKFNLRDFVSNKPSYLDARFVARANSSTLFKIDINNEVFSTLIQRINGSSEDEYARTGTIRREFNVNNINSLEIEFDTRNATTAEGWIDFIQILAPFHFTENSTQTEILCLSNPEEAKSSAFKTDQEYQYLFDVTDYSDQKIIPYKNGLYTFENKVNNKFIAVNNDYKRLAKGVLTPNQNLHALSGDDLIIIYNPLFKEAADKLATHRRDYSNYTVSKVDINQIYNEYSSGRVDPTAIRDFAKQLKAKDDQFSYLLLLGDGSYDYRHINKSNPNHNFIPVYETQESLDPINGFPSDDYYTFFDDNEGANNDSKSMDIAIGRIPVTTEEQAFDVVNKIIHYDTHPNTYGNWRNNAVFAADDEDSNIHIRDCNLIADQINKEDKNMIVSKIYIDAYKQQSTSGGDRYPEASEALNRTVNKGALTIAYLGHGGPRGWAQERLLKKSDIDQWNNFDKMPLLVTATCSFAGYDEPSVVSAGEYSLLKSNGGVIGLFTTTRAVYSSSNKILTESVFEILFKKDHNGSITIGEALRKAKNTRGSSKNSRKFTLLGDPSMKLAIPEYEVKTTSITSNEAVIDTVSALQPITITGQIEENDNLINSFNGEVDITFYDKQSTFKTLANDSNSYEYIFTQNKNIVFRGKAQVENGTFNVSFVVPKDINYDFGKGKISYYAYDSNNQIDATGHYDKFIIGGSGNETNDTTGPKINAYLNDRNFVSGNTVPSNSLLIVDLEDELGINVTGSSIGHDLIGTLDGNTSQPFILNEYYTASTDYRKGTLSYPLNNLTPGAHTLTIKAWDSANNSNSNTINFIVEEESDAIKINISPNPIENFLTLEFNNTDLINFNGIIEIYDTMGRLVLSRNTNTTRTSINLNSNNLLPGIYFCKIKITSSQLDRQLESDFSQIIKI